MGIDVISNSSAAEYIGATGYFSWNVPENRVYGDDVMGYVFDLSKEDLAAGAPIEAFFRYVDDGDRQVLARRIHEAILSGEPSGTEFHVTLPDGTKLKIFGSGRCLRDAAGVPSIYSGYINVYTATGTARASYGEREELESHCRAALGLATRRRNTLAARYLSSALHVLHAPRT